MSHKEEALTDFIIHQSYPPCRDMDRTKELRPCTVTNQKDYTNLRSGNSECVAPSGHMMPSCRDGTNTMTCLLLSMKPVEYMCVCSAEKGNLNTGIRWDDNWEEITECRVPVLKRSLCDTQAGWCLGGMFCKNLVYLVKTYAPLDSQITASSEYTTDFTAKKARLEYNGDVCAWGQATDDKKPWLKFDLSHV